MFMMLCLLEHDRNDPSCHCCCRPVKSQVKSQSRCCSSGGSVIITDVATRQHRDGKIAFDLHFVQGIAHLYLCTRIVGNKL